MSPVPGPPVNLLYWLLLAIAILVLLIIWHEHVSVN